MIWIWFSPIWPALIWSIFLVWIIWYIKEPLLDFLKNIGTRSKKISWMGFDLDLGSSANLTIGNQEQMESKAWAFTKAYQSEIITNEERTIRSQLIDAGVSPDQAITILIYQLAHNIFFKKLFWINNLIFPEQKRLLMYLNTLPKPSPSENLQYYYFEWKEKNKENDYPFEQFLNFLANQNLILWVSTGYIISPFGREYLGFIIKMGDPIITDKPINR